MPQALLEISLSHPAFAGHFPDRPIVPGVVLLDLVQRAIESANAVALSGISVAKFHNPAGPGDELLLEYALSGNTARFEIRCGARKIADGKFVIDAEPPAR